MVEGYTTALVKLPLFKKYISSNEKFIVANKLIDSSLISLKICHHLNISENDLDDVCVAIEKVITYLLEKLSRTSESCLPVGRQGLP